MRQRNAGRPDARSSGAGRTVTRRFSNVRGCCELNKSSRRSAALQGELGGLDDLYDATREPRLRRQAPAAANRFSEVVELGIQRLAAFGLDDRMSPVR
jgi:hypothetical protein